MFNGYEFHITRIEYRLCVHWLKGVMIMKNMAMKSSANKTLIVWRNFVSNSILKFWIAFDPKVGCQVWLWIKYKKLNHHNETNDFLWYVRSLLFLFYIVILKFEWIDNFFECHMLIFLNVTSLANLTDLKSDFRENSLGAVFCWACNRSSSATINKTQYSSHT